MTTTTSEILRTSFCSPEILGGTKLTCEWTGKRFLVYSRFQSLKSFEDLARALEYFEHVLTHGI